MALKHETEPFQFHIGAIRRLSQIATSTAATSFQFHIGAIRRWALDFCD